MRPSTLRALNRAAELTRQNRLTEAMLIAEPVILTADEYEGEEIWRWLLDHVADFTGENHDEPKEPPLMPANPRFRRVVRIGPVQVGTYYDGRGREKHAAVCTAPRCGFSADYDSRTAAELAARTHRCRVR